MRELTKYEKKKYVDEYDRFDAPEFLGYGDESGEYYDAFVEAEKAASYLPSPEDKELQNHLRAVILDYHYHNLVWLLNKGRNYKEEIILPPIEEVEKRQERYVEKGVDPWTAYRLALDWVYKWREKNADEIERQLEVQRLEYELMLARIGRQ